MTIDLNDFKDYDCKTLLAADGSKQLFAVINFYRNKIFYVLEYEHKNIVACQHLDEAIDEFNNFDG